MPGDIPRVFSFEFSPRIGRSKRYVCQPRGNKQKFPHRVAALGTRVQGLRDGRRLAARHRGGIRDFRKEARRKWNSVSVLGSRGPEKSNAYAREFKIACVTALDAPLLFSVVKPGDDRGGSTDNSRNRWVFQRRWENCGRAGTRVGTRVLTRAITATANNSRAIHAEPSRRGTTHSAGNGTLLFLDPRHFPSISTTAGQRKCGYNARS